MKKQTLGYRGVAATTLAVVILSAVAIGPPTTTARINHTSFPMMIDLTQESVNQEAGKYTVAVNEIKSIRRMSFKTDGDFKRASAIIQSHARNLSRVRARMVQIALSNPTFTKSVQDELQKLSSDDVRVMRRHRLVPGLITSLPGAAQTQQEMSKILREDSEGVKTAAEALKEAAAARGRHHANYTREAPAISSLVEPPMAGNFVETLLLATNVLAGAVQPKVLKGPKPEKSGSGGAPSGGSTSSSTYQLEQSDFDSCMEKAEANYDSCKRERNCRDILLSQWACLAPCDAAYLLAAADCAFNSVH
jgi:hypothetical protein